jgi:hypothetical protein
MELKEGVKRKGKSEGRDRREKRRTFFFFPFLLILERELRRRTAKSGVEVKSYLILNLNCVLLGFSTLAMTGFCVF